MLSGSFAKNEHDQRTRQPFAIFTGDESNTIWSNQQHILGMRGSALIPAAPSQSWYYGNAFPREISSCVSLNSVCENGHDAIIYPIPQLDHRQLGADCGK
jgi:hypothetical protein